ncbi:hypothetical protein ACP70R_010371 [Stipagrostis hirtigluma subsp. patula]
MSTLAKALAALVAAASVAELAAGKNYTIEWAVGGNYVEWSAEHPVRVGDTVVFTYGQPHRVDELSAADYEACSFATPVSSDGSGSTAVTFDKAGTRYFACPAGAGTHCSRGQKVSIAVVGSALAPPLARGNAAATVARAAGLAAKVVLGLGVGGAFLLAAF